MSTCAKDLTDKANDAIKKLVWIQEWAAENASFLQAFGSPSLHGELFGGVSIYLHPAWPNVPQAEFTAACKVFAAKFGTNWTRNTNGSRCDWRGNLEGIEITIFHAEEVKEPEPLVFEKGGAQ